MKGRAAMQNYLEIKKIITDVNINRKMFFDSMDDGVIMFTTSRQADGKYHLVFSNTKSKQIIGSMSND